jgi:integrase
MFCGHLLVTFFKIWHLENIMSKAIKLTKRIIDSFVCEKDWDVRWDSELSGFGIRLYPGGKKSFVLSYRVMGKKKLMVIGNYGALTLEEARNIAKLKFAELIQGKDPSLEKQKKAKNLNMAEFADQYIENYAKKHKKSWSEDQRRLEKNILPFLSNKKINSINRNDILNIHNKMGLRAPYEANRTLRLLSKMFEIAKEWGHFAYNEANPAKGIKLFKEEKRDRWLTHNELPQLIEAVDKEQNLYARISIWLYLLTGMRKSELLTAKWSDIDFERKEIRLSDTKAGRVHYVPLSEAAIDLLTSVPRLEENPYIIPGAIKGKHMVNISKPWLRIRKAASLEDIRLHDLRRTVGSWLAQSGNSLHLIGKVLNHSNQSTTAIYARFAQDDVRNALEGHGKMILEKSKKLLK